MGRRWGGQYRNLWTLNSDLIAFCIDFIGPHYLTYFSSRMNRKQGPLKLMRNQLSNINKKILYYIDRQRQFSVVPHNYINPNPYHTCFV